MNVRPLLRSLALAFAFVVGTASADPAPSPAPAAKPSLALGATTAQVRAACDAADGTFAWRESPYAFAQHFTCEAQADDGLLQITSFLIGGKLAFVQIRAYADPDLHELITEVSLDAYVAALGDPECEPGLCIWKLDGAVAVMVARFRLAGDHIPETLVFIFEAEGEQFRLLKARAAA